MILTVPTGVAYEVGKILPVGADALIGPSKLPWIRRTLGGYIR